MTDIGGLIYDKDATFLEMHGNQKNIGASIPNIDDRRVPLINEMKKVNLGHDDDSDDDDDQEHLRLFAGTDAITANESDNEESDDGDSNDDDDAELPRVREEKVVDGGRVRRKAVFDRDAPDVAGHSDDGGSDDEHDAPPQHLTREDEDDGVCLLLFLL